MSLRDGFIVLLAQWCGGGGAVLDFSQTQIGANGCFYRELTVHFDKLEHQIYTGGGGEQNSSFI